MFLGNVPGMIEGMVTGMVLGMVGMMLSVDGSWGIIRNTALGGIVGFLLGIAAGSFERYLRHHT